MRQVPDIYGLSCFFQTFFIPSISKTEYPKNQTYFLWRGIDGKGREIVAHKNYYAHLSNNRRYSACPIQRIRRFVSTWLLKSSLVKPTHCIWAAGVDFDFPSGGREYASLTAISQTAGRMNRNGRSRQSSSSFFGSCAKVQNIQHALRKASFTEHTIENLIPLNQCCFFTPEPHPASS